MVYASQNKSYHWHFEHGDKRRLVCDYVIMKGCDAQM
jgi:hypothetical protein